MGSPAPYSFVPHPEQRHQRRRHPSRDPVAGLIRETTSVEQVVLMPQLPTPISPQQQQLVLRPHHQNQVITTATSDVDAAMARAMLAVISNSDRPNYQARRRDFEPYDGAAPAKTGAAAQVRQGQGMIERAPLSDVPRELITGGSPPAGSGRQLSSSSSQMNHVMSERKRREKLNESFDALRATLPPGLTKRDKASILAGAMDVVKNLRAEISELEGKNRSMEARLPPPPADGATGASREERAVLLDRSTDDDDPAAAGDDQIMVRVVKIDHDSWDPGAGRRTSASSAGGLQRIQLRVAAPVPESGDDVVDLVVHVLECLEKAIGGGVVKLVSLEAGVDHGGRQIMNPIGRAVVTMQIKMDDWDEDSFKRSIARAVQEATASSPPPETVAPP